MLLSKKMKSTSPLLLSLSAVWTVVVTTGVVVVADDRTSSSIPKVPGKQSHRHRHSLRPAISSVSTIIHTNKKRRHVEGRRRSESEDDEFEVWWSSPSSLLIRGGGGATPSSEAAAAAEAAEGDEAAAGDDNSDEKNYEEVKDKEEEDGAFEITLKKSSEGRNNIQTKFQLPRGMKEVVDAAVKNDASTTTTAAATNKSAMSVVGGSSSTTAGTNHKSQTHISSSIPITPTELPHFISMSVMMFLFIYVFTTVRDTKDTLVVSNCGAESIPFLKLYGVMPSATAFIVLYSKLSNVLGKQTLFYVTLIPFFIFYGVFAFILFPNRDLIHFPLDDGGASAAGGGGAVHAAMNLVRYWSFSLYFIVSELWASAGVPLLFWQVRCIYKMSGMMRFSWALYTPKALCFVLFFSLFLSLVSNDYDDLHS